MTPGLLFSCAQWSNFAAITDFMNNLDHLLREAIDLFSGIDDAVELEQAKARYLGRQWAN